MRVIVVHNRYVSSMPSGENSVVDAEIRSLLEQGVEVIPYLRSSDEIARFPLRKKAELPFRAMWSFEDTRAVARLIDDRRPDVMHLHNPNPLISLGVVRVAKRHGAAVVRTVHNHRHSCLNGVFYRDGHECHDCVGHRFPYPGVRHACYRGSRPQSLAAATALTAHRGSYRLIDRHIALTPQMARSVEASGVPTDRIVVKPNTVPDPGPTAPMGSGFLFVGRLREEKGIQLLLDAWERSAPAALGTLTIVGDGPDRPRVEALAGRRGDIRVRGTLDPAGVAEAYRDAAVVVIPSVCPEAFPAVALEAMAAGRPIVATQVGGLADVVTDAVGWCVPANVDAVRGALNAATDRNAAATRAAAARSGYETRYSPGVVVAQLLGIYSDVTTAAHPHPASR